MNPFLAFTNKETLLKQLVIEFSKSHHIPTDEFLEAGIHRFGGLILEIIPHEILIF